MTLFTACLTLESSQDAQFQHACLVIAHNLDLVASLEEFWNLSLQIGGNLGTIGYSIL